MNSKLQQKGYPIGTPYFFLTSNKRQNLYVIIDDFCI
nr:MAG TPA: hypothetical protein [Caudoviricetes sp.]